METYKASKLPFDFTLNNELLKLLCEANSIYGEYKGFLKNMQYDYKCFLENSLINELFYSFKIDGCKITKELMFHSDYLVKSNESIEFNNMKKCLLIGLNDASKENISLDTFNKIDKKMFEDCKKDNLTKGSGKFRKIQNYILKPGLAGASVSFIPPLYSEVNDLMKNLVDYINKNDDMNYISVSLSHYQFEKIHPYVSGNGKIGRLFIPIQLSLYKKEPPVLFLSESFDNLKNTYFTFLSSNSDDIYGFVKMFLQCIIDQCNINIKRIKKLNKVYHTDIEEFKNVIGGTTIFKVYPVILKKIVFTTNDIVSECKLHINSVNKVLNKLVESGYLIKEKKKGTNRVTFCYKNAYDVFIN